MTDTSREIIALRSPKGNRPDNLLFRLFTLKKYFIFVVLVLRWTVVSPAAAISCDSSAADGLMICWPLFGRLLSSSMLNKDELEFCCLLCDELLFSGLLDEDGKGFWGVVLSSCADLFILFADAPWSKMHDMSPKEECSG